MPEDSEQKNGVDLPPKLDLRKQGILKRGPVSIPGAKAKEPEPATVQPVQSGQTETTVRIKIPGQPVATQAAEAPAAAPAPAAAAAETKRPAIRIGPPTGSPAAAAAAAVQPEAAPQTAKPSSGAIKPITVSVPNAAGAAAAPVRDTKRETSRVPLEAATVFPKPEGGTPKTIRIKPKGGATQASTPLDLSKLAQDASETMAEAAPAAPEGAEGSKHKTSRISLEAALATDEQAAAAEAPGGPKTIRLRRPTEASTVKVQQTPPQVAEEPKVVKEAMGKTARLDEVPLEEEGPTPTRRKTIRVKRPPARTTVSAGQPVAGQAAAMSPGARPPVAFASTSDDCHWVFPTGAIMSVLTLIVVLYMLLAQVVGPNVSLTEYSYAKGGPNLAWPGKMTR